MQEVNDKKTNGKSKSDKFYELQPTIPTVGTNVVKLNMQKKAFVEVRELGGCMGPIWKSYYGSAKGLVYIVDSSNAQQISSSVVQLINTLKQFSEQYTHNNDRQMPLLLVFNKSDIPTHTNISQLKSLYQFNLIQDMFTSCVQIDCIELSCLNKEEVIEVGDWLIRHQHVN